MSKNAVSHGKPKLSFVLFLTLLFAVVSVSFGTIIYSADTDNTEKESKNAVSKTSNLNSIFNSNPLLNSNNSVTESFALSPSATFTVNNNGDSNDVTPGDGICMDASGNCTLRAAIQEANATAGIDSIIFSLTTPATIELNPNLSSGELIISEGITITGPGARLLTITVSSGSGARPAESPEATSSLFKINTNTSVTAAITGLTIVNPQGRGITNDGRLNLSDTVIRLSQMGIYNNGRLNLNRTLIHNNAPSGGIFLGEDSITNINNTTITNNSSSGHGGGIHSLSGDLTLNNVTISNNTATTSGGGLYYSHADSGVFLRNTLIANNTAPAGPDVFVDSETNAEFVSRGNNLIGKSDADLGFENGVNSDKVGTIESPLNPLLGELRNNGGNTNTRALLDGSPARDAGNNCVANSSCAQNPPNPPSNFLNSDQRGTEFPRNFGGGVDIGAFESYYPAPSITSLSPEIRGAGSGNFNLTINGSNFVADSVAKWNNQERPTLFFSNTQLRVSISASDIVNAGQYPVTVTNPSPGGGTSEEVNFTVVNCSYSLSPTFQNFTAAGGNGGTTVTAVNGCAWTAVSSVEWISVTTGDSGTGNGTVTFTVAPNTGPARNGVITIGGQTFTVSQAGGCVFTLSPVSTEIVAGGGGGSFSVTSSNSACAWNAVNSEPSWITITGGASGTGNGTVTFTVAANTGPARTGTITVGDKTFTITQANGCSFTLNPVSTEIVAGGGGGSFSVNAGAGCAWTAVTNAPSWITITGGASGTGNGTVNFTVAANTGPARTGTITVGGQTFTVNQASSCILTISPTSANIPAAGITDGSINVTVNSGCAWTTVTNAPSWITITGGASGTGNGTVTFTVAANTGPARTGTITVGDKTFTITQANGCSFTLTPSSLELSASGGTGFFNVTVGAGCAWTAVTNAPSWITITGGASGTGNGTVNYSIAVNTGPARTGTITVGDKTFTITQANGCSFTLNPVSTEIVAGGGGGSFSVTSSNSACAWNATANAQWITITGGASGTGNGTVTFTVAANTGPARTGTITVGDKTFTITQLNGCTYSLTPTQTGFGAGGGSGSFAVTVNNPACGWTAVPSASWITINSGASGTGNGEVSFTVAANVSPQRTGTINVNGQIFTITQDNGCSYSLAPTSADISAGVGTYTFNVNSGSGCTWTVQSNASWITIDSAGSGSGSGIVRYIVTANTGPERTGTISVNGQSVGSNLTFTVRQANGCSFTLTPTSRDVSAGGVSNSLFNVTTVAGCQWTAVSNVSWISITVGASGTGNGVVQFSVQANISPEREGTITVGNSITSQTFTVRQANGCTYSISPTSTGVDEKGGIRTFNVLAGPGCTWTSQSNNTWIVITGGASGTGNGTVTLSISANDGEERTGTVTAAGHTFTVNQISLRVTNLNDSGIGSLRRAIANANSTPHDDVITFLPSLTGTIVLTSGEITITNSGKLEIRGSGANVLKISGNRNSRIFYIDDAEVTISGLELTRGNGTGRDSNDSVNLGGAIYVNFGSLKLDHVYFFDNNTIIPAGQGRSKGGSIYYYGGANHKIEYSTFTFNRADYGGGYFNQTGPVSIVNSTFFGNSANKEGGAIIAIGNTTLRNVTITNNTATNSRGAGLLIEGGRIEVGNTIISKNSGAEITFAFGEFLSLGNNLIGDAPGDSSNTEQLVGYHSSDRLNIPPLTSALSFFGGVLPTVALFPGSPAIDAGNNANVPATDQRGSPRIIGGIVDIGAFENNITIEPSNPILPNATIGTFYNQTLTTTRSNDSNPFAYFEYFTVDGFLPGGITVNQESGTLSGNPNLNGTYTFTLKSVGEDGMAGAKEYTISVGCNFSVNLPNQSFGAAGGNGTINTTASTGCSWSAQSNVQWITFPNGTAGNGNGTINFAVAANNGAARTGTITAAGQNFTINQAAGSCSYSIAPTEQSVSGAGIAGSFAVTASNSGCAWTAVSNAPSWLTITSGTSGTGSGTVNYSVAANTGAARIGTISVGGQTFTANQASGTILNRTQYEFDGDGRADFAVFRPSNGSWYILGSRDGFMGFAFGFGTDKPVPADYDGDGRTDIAVYREGIWYVQQSRDGFFGIAFGQAEDIPQPGDYDGDGKADIAVFRPSTGAWYVLGSRDGFFAVTFGASTDKPMRADYDGDGKTDIAVYRDGIWHILGSRDGYFGVAFGMGTDTPIPADYDGDGKADIAVYRDGIWHILRSRDGYLGIAFGLGTDKPVPADYDGDGKADITVYRDGTWHTLESSKSESAGYRAVQFGDVSDIPIPASLQ